MWRANWSENLANLARSASLYSNTSLPEAFGLPVSAVEAFFESKAFEEWKKARESEVKMQAAIVDRLNGVIRASGVLAKILGRRR